MSNSRTNSSQLYQQIFQPKTFGPLGTVWTPWRTTMTLQKKETAVVAYEQEIPETVEIYIVTKKIAGLSETSLYLYLMVLKDFFYTVRKQPEKVTANDIRIYLYQYQKVHGISA